MFFHDEIHKNTPLPFHPLFPDDPVTSFFKKRSGGNGRVGDDVSPNFLLQRIAYGRGDALSLKILMDIETVKIALAADIAKTCYCMIFFRDDAVMFQK